jgi:hypothetical protein
MRKKLAKEAVMAKRGVIIDEWLLVLRGPRGTKRGQMSVKIGNVEPQDRPMARALAKVAAAWFRATRA